MTKRTYTRKYKFNKQYRGKYTQRELANRIKFTKVLLCCFLLISIYQYIIITPNSIHIDGCVVLAENTLSGFDEPTAAILVNLHGDATVQQSGRQSSDVKTIEEQITQLANEHNFKWPEYLVNLACCEGLLKTETINNKGNIPSYSIDRGLYGINNFWHSEISDDCAFDLHCSTVWTMNRINEGYQYEWMCNKRIKGIANYAKTYCGSK